MMTTPETVDQWVTSVTAQGPEYAETVQIPTNIAQTLARRYVVEHARTNERKATRAIEEAAERERSQRDRERRAQARAERVAIDSKLNSWLDSTGTFELPYVDQGKTRALQHRYSVWADDMPLIREQLLDLMDRNVLPVALGLIRNAAVAINREENEVRQRNQTKWRDALDELIDQQAERLGMHWTAALLTETVALPDGSRVLWGEATVSDHLARIQLLSRHAATELATATRHRAAVNYIEATPGATCLNDVVKAAA